MQPEILSTPNFVVEVTKEAVKETLVIDCQFLQDEVHSANTILEKKKQVSAQLPIVGDLILDLFGLAGTSYAHIITCI